MKIGSRTLRPIPWSLIGILALGSAAIIWISRESLYPALGIDRPLWFDIALMLFFDLLLLILRELYPRVWEKLTTEKPEK